jgi:hypothetical protein
MATVKHTKDFEINQPIKTLFPLFSPEGELLWVPGWDYESVTGANKLHEDFVFLTRNHDHASTEAIWLTKKYQPESHLVQFYKVEPEIKVAIISIKCTKLNASRTKVTVSYEYVGLSESGNAFIEAFAASDYDDFIAEWEKLLEIYFQN